MIDLNYIREINPMFDEQSAKYENLLCYIYGFEGKTYRHGACHEIFDGMLNDACVDEDGQFEDSFAAGVAMGKVATFLEEAFEYAIEESGLDVDALAKIKECLDTLVQSEPLTVESIRQSVDTAYLLFGLD